MGHSSSLPNGVRSPQGLAIRSVTVSPRLCSLVQAAVVLRTLHERAVNAHTRPPRLQSCRLEEHKAEAGVPLPGRREQTAGTRNGLSWDLGHEGEGNTAVRVALFITCFNDTLFPETGRATVEVLERLGV